MLKGNNIFVIVLLLVLSGCTGSSEKTETEKTEEEVDYSSKTIIQKNEVNPDSRIFLSNQVDSVNLGGQIKNPGYMEVVNDTLYLVSFESMKIFLTSLDDVNFSEILGGIGRGPGEYIQIADFKVLNSKIYVSDEDQSKMDVYDLSGNVLNTYTEDFFGMHRFEMLNQDVVVSLNPMTIEDNIINKVSLPKVEVIGSFFEKKEDFSPLVTEGQLGTDSKGNVYYAGFSEPVIISWDADGNERYRVDVVNDYISRSNYIQFSPSSNQQAFRYSPNAFFYANDLVIGNGRIFALVKKQDNKFVDVYNSEDGKYEGSFNVNSEASDIAVDDSKLYVLNMYTTTNTIDIIEL